MCSWLLVPEIFHCVVLFQGNMYILFLILHNFFFGCPIANHIIIICNVDISQMSSLFPIYIYKINYTFMNNVFVYFNLMSYSWSWMDEISKRFDMTLNIWDILHEDLIIYCQVESPVASFTKEVNPWFAKRQLKNNGCLANRGLTSFVKEATVNWANRLFHSPWPTEIN